MTNTYLNEFIKLTTQLMLRLENMRSSILWSYETEEERDTYEKANIDIGFKLVKKDAKSTTRMPTLLRHKQRDIQEVQGGATAIENMLYS